MSIENTLERIAVALEKMASGPSAPVAAAPAPTPAPAAPVAPTPAPAPAPAAPAPSAAPFNDTAGLIKYVTESYQAMGPEKGMKIQGILQQLGHTNINEVPTEEFGPLYQAIEELKAS